MSIVQEQGQLNAIIAEKLMGWQRWQEKQSAEATLLPPNMPGTALEERVGSDVPLKAASIRVLPEYSTRFGYIKDIADAMNRRGFWLKLTSPFMPGDEFKPKNPDYIEQWQATRHHWFAGFDFYGTTDSRPVWVGSAENPAEAVAQAAVACIEAHPEIFD